MLEIYRW